MTDGSASLMTMAHSFLAAGMSTEARGRTCSTPGAHFYEVYETADARYVAVGAIEPRFYAALLEGLGLDPAELPHQMDRTAWPAMKVRLAACFATRTRDEWTAVFEGTEACVAPVLSPLEARDHPHNVARGTFVEVAGVRQPGPAPRFSSTPRASRRRPRSRAPRRARRSRDGASTRVASMPCWPPARSAAGSRRGSGIAEALPHVPPVAQVAAVDVELDAVEHPAELRRVGCLALGRVARLRDAVASEVPRRGRRRRRGTPNATLRHPPSLPGRSRDHYARSMAETSGVLERTEAPVTEDGDRERLTHIVLEGFKPTESEFVATGNSVVAGMVNATPVVALCGKTWVPGRDPARYPLCGTCKEIAATLGWSVPRG